MEDDLRTIKGLVLSALLSIPLWVGIIYVVRAEEPPPISFSAQERQALLQMCDTAKWASRIQFEQACEALKKRFEDTDKKAAEVKK